MRKIGLQLLFLIFSGIAMAQPAKLKDFNGMCTNHTPVGNLIYYTCGSELWKSDGTTSGTVLVIANLRNPRNLTAVGNRVYFLTDSHPEANEAEGTVRMYYTEGTSSSTRYFYQFISVDNMIAFKGKLYFTDDSGELMATSGTSVFTVKEIYPGEGKAIKPGSAMKVYNDHLYFSANDGVHGTQLWRTDGNTPGTVLYHSVNYNEEDPSVNIHDFVVYQNKLYFLMDANGFGPTIFASTDGVNKVDHLFTWGDNSMVRNLTVSNNRIYFTDKGPDSGYILKLYYFQGSVESVEKVADLGYYWDWADNFMDVNGTLFFTMNNDGFDWQLWKTNGTEAGTQKFFSVSLGRYSQFEGISVGGKVLFEGYPAYDASTYDPSYFEQPLQLWQTDLTMEGTAMVKDIYPQLDLSFPNKEYESYYNFVQLNNAVYFTSSNTSSTSFWKYTPDTFNIGYFTTINTVTDKDIKVLAEGDTIFTDQKISFRANATGPVGTVKFYINDVLRRTESSKPFALAGDFNGDYTEWTKSKGNYKLTGIPFGTNGVQGKASTINFIVLAPSDTVSSPAMRLVLVNSQSNTDVRDLSSNDTIRIGSSLPEVSIKALPPTPAGSVVFYVDGAVYRTENSAPYAIKGDYNGDYTAWPVSNGSHTVSVSSYSGSGGSGTLLETRTISIWVASGTTTNPAQISFTLINAATDQEIGPLLHNQIIDLSKTGNKLNIRANSSLAGTKSVSFDFNGKTRYKVESAAPYALFGDSNGNYSTWTPATGTYTLSATPYTNTGGTGTAGTPLSITFHITGNANRLSAYPNPAEGATSLSLEGDQEPDGMAEVIIFDQEGKEYFRESMEVARLKSGVNLDLYTINLTPGLYFIEMRRDNEEPKVVKLIKK